MDSDDDDDDNATSKPLVLRYYGFAEGMRWIFPHALERELEELWRLVDRRERGYVSYWKLMKRVVRPARSRSPEPGPTHYSPQFSVVEPKSVAAVILPETLETEPTAGLPSELFMNYDAFKAVKPRATAAVFPKRQPDASWCNPVAREPFDAAPDERLDDAETVVMPRGGSGSSDMRHSQQQAGARFITPRPPRHEPSRRTSAQTPRGTAAAERERGRAIASPSLARPQRLLLDSSADSGRHASESPHAAASTQSSSSSSKEATARSPRGAHHTPPLRTMDAAAAMAATRSSFSSMNPSSGRNLFYNDIAPLYLKFLTSKEVQKFMKQ